MLRCRTLPSKDNFPRQQPTPWFLRQIFFRLYSAALSFPPRGVTRTSCYRFEYDLHLIKILSHIDCESIYSGDGRASPTSPSQREEGSGQLQPLSCCQGTQLSNSTIRCKMFNFQEIFKCTFKIYGIWLQASTVGRIHTHLQNAVLLVWGSLQ